MGIWIWPGILGLAACGIFLIWYVMPRTSKVVIDLSGLGDDEREEERGQVERIHDELEIRLASAFNEGYGDFKNGRASWFSPDEGVQAAETDESLRGFLLEQVQRMRVSAYLMGYRASKDGKPNQAEEWLEADKRTRGDFFALVEETL